jgi:hypothetical protein
MHVPQRPSLVQMDMEKKTWLEICSVNACGSEMHVEKLQTQICVCFPALHTNMSEDDLQTHLEGFRRLAEDMGSGSGFLRHLGSACSDLGFVSRPLWLPSKNPVSPSVVATHTVQYILSGTSKPSTDSFNHMLYVEAENYAVRMAATAV